MPRRTLLAALALAVFTTAIACNADDLTSPEEQGIAQIRSLTDAYHDLNAASAAGYTAWSPDPTVAGATCPSDPAQGQMGYHRVNVALRGSAADPGSADPQIELTRPEMLIFEKTASGGMQLVGVEYIVFKAAWERAHGAGAAPPEILGHPLLASAHAFPGGAGNIEHYELHVWVWKDNPNGMFAPYNPRVTC